jgi:nucleoside-diphosphate-sugar epimerase
MAESSLITGSARFVGSDLGRRGNRAGPDFEVRALDNLRRGGSELALAFVSGRVPVAWDFRGRVDAE